MAFAAPIAIGASIASAGLGAYGAMSKGRSDAAMYNYQAGVGDLNKKINLQNADYERSVGEVEAQQSGMKTRFQLGKMKSGQAASGINVNSGSASDTRSSQLSIGQMDEGTIRQNAARRAYGYEVKAAGDEASSTLARSAASNSNRAGEIGAISSILGGASSVASKWTQAGQVGLGSGQGDWIGNTGYKGWLQPDNPR